MATSMLSSARRRLAAGAAILPLIIGGSALGTAGPADAAGTCTHPSWSNKDSAKGTGNSSSTAVRNGPSGDCALVATVGTNVVLHYHCWAENPYTGATWTSVRIDGTNIDGWVWDGNLDDNGSFIPC